MEKQRMPALEGIPEEEGSTSPARARLVPLLAGAVSGVAVVLVGQPFDTVKVRQQVLQSRLLHTVAQCVQSEGLAGLYKGTSPQLLGSAVQHSLRMGSYGIAKDCLVQRGQAPGVLVGAAAGAFTGCCVALVATPVERVKCIQQMERSKRMRIAEVLDLLKGGNGASTRPRAWLLLAAQLYSGLTPTLWRSILGNVAAFSCYEV
jgi:hypothetical protein